MIAITLSSVKVGQRVVAHNKQLSTTNKQSFAELKIATTIQNSPQLMFYRKYHSCIFKGYIMSDFSLTDIFNMREKEIYYVSNHISKHYKKVEIPKKTKGVRILYIPSKKLMYMQRIILNAFLSEYRISECATAYHKGSTLVSNAQPHRNKKYVLKLDIEDFFGSITYGRVYKMFFKHFPVKYAKLFTEICCYNDKLVQGAPTSPAISNIIMLDFDNRVESYCKENNISYTRYCDDITLSADFSLDRTYYRIKKELQKAGFELNKRKTHFVKNTHQQRITGVVVNEKIQVPIEYRKKLRQELYYLYKFGANNVILKNNYTDYISNGNTLDVKYINSLLGRINYVLQIDPDNNEFVKEKEKLCSYVQQIKIQKIF